MNHACAYVAKCFPFMLMMAHLILDYFEVMFIIIRVLKDCSFTTICNNAQMLTRLSHMRFDFIGYLNSNWTLCYKPESVARAGQPLWRIHQPGGEWCSRRCNQQTRTENNRENQSTQYLTRFGNVPTSSGQGREILLIQQSIQTNTDGYLRELSGIPYMRALALIYSHRVLGV